MTNNDDTPTTPLDDARDPGPAPEPSTRPASENPAPKRSVARPLLIGAAAGVGVLLLGGLGALAVDALTDGRDGFRECYTSAGRRRASSRTSTL